MQVNLIEATDTYTIKDPSEIMKIWSLSTCDNEESDDYIDEFMDKVRQIITLRPKGQLQIELNMLFDIRQLYFYPDHDEYEGDLVVFAQHIKEIFGIEELVTYHRGVKYTF